MELDGDRLEELMRRHRRQFVDAGTRALAAEIEPYAAVPGELLHGDVARTIRNNIELFITTIATGELPAPHDLEEIRVSAARRAEEGLSLEMIMAAYHLVARVVVQRLAVLAGQEHVSLSTDLVGRITDFLGVVSATAAGGFLEELQQIETGSRTVADGMLESLLTGAPRPALETYALADEYSVLALSIARHADELQPGVDASMAARRKLRRVRSLLREVCDGQQPMASLTPAGGLALIPLTPGIADGKALTERLEDVAQAPVTAAVTTAAPDDIAAAARLTREVLDVVLLLERPPGTYRLEDVSFEYQVTRPGAARTALARMLAPIGDDPLLATLRAFLATGGNRHRTARLVSAHPNTVDNRMRKLAGLTGYDPTRPDDATRLRMALLARDAEARS
ncbi:PucR family transcriptional regulator [Nocardioides sp. CPCC 206347]|uniref:PucR family transcriptional regulator n=1 Tax=unclassified Nocardioides TaxID=2615069 RepID=UPI00361B7A79